MTGVFLWFFFCQCLENGAFLGIELEEYLPSIVWVLRSFCFKVGIEFFDGGCGAHPPLTVGFDTDEFLYFLYGFSPYQCSEIGIDQLECGMDVPGVPSSLERVVIVAFDDGDIDFWVLEWIEFWVTGKFADISWEVADIALFAAPYLPLFLGDTGIIVSVVDTFFVCDDEHECVIVISWHAAVGGQYGVNCKDGTDRDNGFSHFFSPNRRDVGRRFSDI